MARCEDFPCCGHEPGCCPDYDESGRQLNMKCTCGAAVPLHSRFSICDACMRRGDAEDSGPAEDDYDFDDDDSELEDDSELDDNDSDLEDDEDYAERGFGPTADL